LNHKSIAENLKSKSGLKEFSANLIGLEVVYGLIGLKEFLFV
jgi:hypothetical protein